MSDVLIEFEYADEDEFGFGDEGSDPDVIWAIRNGEKVGYIQFYVFSSLEELHDEIEPERYGWTVEGPFLQPPFEGAGAAICYLADIAILPEHRGSGVYDKLVAELEQMGLPVYACFTNKRLGERWNRVHRVEERRDP